MEDLHALQYPKANAHADTAADALGRVNDAFAGSSTRVDPSWAAAPALPSRRFRTFPPLPARRSSFHVLSLVLHLPTRTSCFFHTSESDAMRFVAIVVGIDDIRLVRCTKTIHDPGSFFSQGWNGRCLVVHVLKQWHLPRCHRVARKALKETKGQICLRKKEHCKVTHGRTFVLPRTAGERRKPTLLY